MKSDALKGKNILVTAGSTWIPIDKVRVITNIFRGTIGFTIAKMAAEMGADVTLLLGPSFDLPSIGLPKTLKVFRFKFFDELDRLVSGLLKEGKFDAMVHSAAISDFQMAEPNHGKIKSSLDKLTLELIPTKKIVDYVKKLAPDIFLVKFKLEVGLTKDELYNVAFESLGKSKADLIVANLYDPEFKEHEAYLINPDGNSEKVVGRENIAKKILNTIHDKS